MAERYDWIPIAGYAAIALAMVALAILFTT
jgi:hypothetical protein